MLALEKKYYGKIEFVIVNVDTQEGQMLAGQYNVTSIPAIFLTDNKKDIAYSVVGAKSQQELEREIEKLLLNK